MAAPRMIPAKVRAEERHEDSIADGLIIVGPDPVESAVHGNIPRVSKSSCHDLQIVSAVIAAQHAAIHAPVISRIVIRTAVLVLVRRHRSREVRHIRRRSDSPQFAKWLWGITTGLIEPLRVPLAHVELAIRSPVQAVQSMFQIAEIGVDLDVLISLVIAISITNDCQVRSVGDPQISPMPCQSLDRIEPGRKFLCVIGTTIAVGILHDHDGVARRLRRRIAILRPHAHEQSTTFIKRHRTRLPDHRFAGE